MENFWMQKRLIEVSSERAIPARYPGPRHLIRDLSGLEIHLRNPNLTLFEACIEDGLLVPSFRDPSVSSFTDAIRLIRKQGIQGVRDSAEDTMLRLQLAAARNKSFRAYVPKKTPWFDVR